MLAPFALPDPYICMFGEDGKKIGERETEDFGERSDRGPGARSQVTYRVEVQLPGNKQKE